jgi:hypothetical protein
MSFITSPGVIVPPLTAGGVAYGTGSQAKVTSAGAAGGVFYSAGAAVPGFTDAGTAGQVLQSNGTSAPSWLTQIPSATSLINTITASSSASLSFTGLSGYDKYMLVFNNISPSVNGAGFIVVVGTGSTTYINAGYDYIQMDAENGQNLQINQGLNTDRISSPGSLGVGNSGVGPGISGFMYFIGMTNSNNIFVDGNVNYRMYNNDRVVSVLSGYLASNTTAKTAIKITPSTGNISSGSLSLYGMTT